ncbi:rubrerythrin family protein [Vulgatibacter sp.]|uniref:rubrerythrin family protein n=1 Tax=Vulgatibacter sp. TaxID=1971226 RepID=UPI003567E183
MKTRTIVGTLLVGSLAVLPAAGAAQPPGAGQDTTSQQQGPAARTETLSNLREAAEGEANAAHRYDLFAQRAADEGYQQVARLFRAAALSERIHLRNHEAVLRSLGEKPGLIELEEVEVKSTRENLRVPIEGEQEEAGATYPSFAAQARNAGLPNAARTFTYAGETERKHLGLFEDALRQLGQNPEVDYLVESESGMVTTQAPGRVASVTGSPSQG